MWHNHRACYVSLREAVAPELEFQGNLGGYVMQCTMLDESSYPFWQSTPEPVPSPPDPALLARRAVDRVEWDMGNGDVVTCGAGTPWQERFVNNEPSPDCGYVYGHPGRHTVTATSHWDVEWEGIGRTGSFAMQLSDSQEIEIAEIQVVITGYG